MKKETQITIGIPGHREYKWRPGNSKRNFRLGHWETNYDRDTGIQGIEMTTGTQGHNYNWVDGGHTGIYKWRRGHRECPISNHHQQSSRAIIRKMRYRSEYGLFFPRTYVYMLHVQESVNLIIYSYAQTMGQRRMLYIRKFY